MNIKRTIDKNYKLIWYIALIIIFALFIIKSLNSYYENDEKEKLETLKNSQNSSNNQSVVEEEVTEDYFSTESNSIDKTMRSFVKYCNDKDIERAYKMLTDECKRAMFPTAQEFEKIYINNIFDKERTYELIKWDTDNNKHIYQVKLFGSILATGNINNYTQEYYTFVEDDNGNYKLNINNYIYGEDRNLQTTEKNITIKIGHVDIYEEYEEVKITITNNTSKTICLTGNKYMKNIYLQNSGKITYSSLNSKFDNEDIIMNSGSVQSFIVRFNKGYSSNNKAVELVLSDVILDYHTYLKSSDKSQYSNRTSIIAQYY